MKQKRKNQSKNMAVAGCVIVILTLAILVSLYFLPFPKSNETIGSSTNPSQEPLSPNDTGLAVLDKVETEAEYETETSNETVVEPEERRLIVIDAGHQAKANYDKEPLGPGSSEMKTKVSSGTQGIATGLEEYRLNLMVAEKLQLILQDRGYDTVMIRTINDVNISNAERAQIANELKADAFIRIHANGSENPQTNGILTVCQTKDNPYNKEFYEDSFLLSEAILDEMVKSTGATRLYVWETDTMSGINWCMVPVTIVEMGFMSNPEEDRKMASESYREQLALGIADGIDRYFGSKD